MSIQVKKIKTRSNYYELHALNALNWYQDCNISLYEIPDRFKRDLGDIPKKTVGTADMFYKAELVDNIKVEIWHLNSKGDKDRLVAELTDNGKQHNPFSF